jgi:hypothetical protein
MDEQLLRLVDHQAIVDAMYAYATAVDLNRPDEQVKVFTEGCRVNYGAGDAGWIHGREALREALRAALAEFVATNHRITNIEIDFAGADAATAVSSVYAWHRYADDRPDFHLFGRYHDVWERRRMGGGCRSGGSRSLARSTVPTPTSWSRSVATRRHRASCHQTGEAAGGFPAFARWLLRAANWTQTSGEPCLYSVHAPCSELGLKHPR